MNTQNMIRNITMKIMAMLMSAIYLTVSVNVPVLADIITDNTITSGEYEGNVTVRNQEGVSVTDSTVTIGNDLSVTSEGTYGRGASAYTSAGQTTVTIGDDLSVTSPGDTTGIDARPSASGQEKGRVTVTVGNPGANEGDVTVTSTDEARGIFVGYNSAASSTSDVGGDTYITVGGNVESTSAISNAKGVFINPTRNESVTNVDIGGAVNATGNTYSVGLNILPSGNNTNEIYVGKGISASAAEATGVNVSAYNTSNTTINIGKDSSGNAITVHSNGNNGNAANSSGIKAHLHTGVGSGSTTATINVEGNIVVNSVAAGAKGIYVNGGNDASLNVQVKGDVTSNGAGIYTEDMAPSDSVDIVVDGTVRSTADGIPAVVLDSDGVDNGTVNVTAWKIESNEGTALLGKTNGVQTLTNDNSQNAVANCISYIIRVTQPEINNTVANVLSLANADGTAWNNKKAWNNGEGVNPTMLDFARENQKVYVKLDVPNGYQLVGVYADAEKTVALSQDENGSYYLTVPRGGGIDVNVALTLIQVDPDPSDTGSNDPSDTGSKKPELSAALPLAEATAPASAIITAAQIQSMILDQLSAMQALGQTVTDIDLNLGDEPNLSTESVLALFDGNIAKRCHFSHDGQNYVLFVPVTDTGSATFAQCLTVLNAEPGGQAGPLRVSQIFFPVGTTASPE